MCSYDIEISNKTGFDLKMCHLEACVNGAKAIEAKYIAVLIEMPGFDKPEIIINPATNFDSKLAYYKSAYGDDLNHKHAAGIKIIGFTHGDSFDEIQNDLIWRE